MYTVHRIDNKPELNGDWENAVWQQAETLAICNWRPESSEHRPRTLARLLYDDENLYGLFRVDDRYVRAVQTEYQSGVCRDSCVEFFVQPKLDKGYFNFEMNCGGTLLVFYVRNSGAGKGALRDYSKLSVAEGQAIDIYHSLPAVVEPEITEPTRWLLQFHIPLRILENYCGALGALSGQEWRANFYKCGDKTSHPHWGSWQPVDKLNFHLPHCFGSCRFE